MHLIPIVFLLSATSVVGVQLNSSKAQPIEPNSEVFIDSAHHTPGSILYVSIFDPNFNRDKNVRDSIDLTQIVDGNPIVEVKILQPTKGTLTLTAVDDSMKASNGTPVRKAVESGPDTSLFEFAVKLPDDMETNSSVTVLYHDPFALTTSQPESASSSSNGVNASLYTDKEEVSLGQDLTLFLEEPDANLDSRTVESIPLNKILISTDKFDETPLDIVLEKTGIETDHSSLRETGPNTGIFEVTLENINSKLADRNSEIRIVFFDETPSGGGPPIRVEKIVPVVPAKIGIAFNKKQYSPFEEVKIALLAQMFNTDRNKVDIVKGNVIVSTSSGQTYYPAMVETGVDTGIFVGKVQLASNQTEKHGDLLVKNGDILRVSAGIIPGFQVSDSATIVANTNTVTHEKPSTKGTEVEQSVKIHSIADGVKLFGLIASLQNDQDGKLAWITSGSWRLMEHSEGSKVNFTSIFKADFTMMKLNGTSKHRHKISDFQLASISMDKMTMILNGSATIALKEGQKNDVPIMIQIMNNSAINIWIDPKIVNHFGSTPIYGMVTKITGTLRDFPVAESKSAEKTASEGYHKNPEKTSPGSSHKNTETVHVGIYLDSHSYSIGQYARVIIVDKNLVKSYDGIDSYRPEGLVTLQINGRNVSDSFLAKVFIVSFRETGPHTAIFKALLRIPSIDDLGHRMQGEELRVNYFDVQNDEVWHDTATVLGS